MNLRISTIQCQLEWENPVANRQRIERMLDPLVSFTDLIILPEMFSTGFSMNPAPLAESMDGETVEWMRQQAVKTQAVITGSLIIQKDEQFFNRLIWIFPDGSLQSYDKRHLFSHAGEDEHYTAGQERTICQWKGWKICPQICYDLRFPVWSRNTVDYDLLIYVANWPIMRRYHWQTLLKARAIENQCYTIGVNRVGMDGNDIPYSGDSMVIDYLGHPIYHISDVENVFTTTLDLEKQQNLRNKLKFLKDRDNYTIHSS